MSDPNPFSPMFLSTLCGAGLVAGFVAVSSAGWATPHGGAPVRVDRLLRQLEDPDVHAQRAAAFALSKSGPSAVPKLMRALKSPHPKVRYWSVEVLSAMESPTKANVAASSR